MKFTKFLPILLVAAVPFVAVSCDDDDDDTTKESFSGSISITMPTYVLKGESKTFKLDTLTTLSREDEAAIGYYFKDPATGTYDTLVFDGGIANPAYPGGVFTITAPDSLDSFTTVLTGYSDGYYANSASATFYTVDPNLDGTGSITGFTDLAGQGNFTDPRDSRFYQTVSAAGLEWMRRNLMWTGAGLPYAKCTAMTGLFGQYYTWEEASTACPEGWRLPTDAEWKALASISGTPSENSEDIPGAAASLMGDLSFNGEKMWEYWPAVKITDATGITALPLGYAISTTTTSSFTGLGDYAVFWTADKEDDAAVYRYIYQDNNTFFRGVGDTFSFRASVRCVR